jgi:hypothetical protein
MAKITQNRLKELLNYNPENGKFVWRFGRSGVQAGRIAGTINGNGYRVIRVDGTLYQAHRLAVLYMEGYFPELTVDHELRDKLDNRYDGLREASQQCQMRNRGMFKNNTSGIRGINWYKRKRKWEASIGLNSKLKHLGYFDNLLDASYTRYAAEQCLGYQDCDINSSAKQYIDKCLEPTR